MAFLFLIMSIKMPGIMAVKIPYRKALTQVYSPYIKATAVGIIIMIPRNIKNIPKKPEVLFSIFTLSYPRIFSGEFGLKSFST